MTLLHSAQLDSSIAYSSFVGLSAFCRRLSRRRPTPDLADYRTVGRPCSRADPPAGRRRCGPDRLPRRRRCSATRKGRLVVEEVQPGSPAAAGRRSRRATSSPASATSRSRRRDAFREWLQAHGPGETVKLGLLRDDKPVEVTATLAATSRPMKLARRNRPIFGADARRAEGGRRRRRRAGRGRIRPPRRPG